MKSKGATLADVAPEHTGLVHRALPHLLGIHNKEGGNSKYEYK